MFLIVWSGCGFFGILAALGQSYGLLDCTQPLDYILLFIVLGTPVWWLPKTLFCTAYFKARQESERKLAQFSVAKAQCLMEDRVKVEGSIEREQADDAWREGGTSKVRPDPPP
jgi:hypothetical protein